ncbi:MAG: translocation/assembly module TamB domain-containing protein [Pacificimonas sp.]|jgi:translocation and assembly module TamB|nr:translocation/assembly module TamB domain-containing protein [Pacificimonas sp.]
MSDPVVSEPETEATAERDGSHVLRWIAIAAGVLLAILALAALLLDTPAGRRFLVQQVDGTTLSSGLKIEIGRVDGSLYREATITDLRLSDLDGVFLTVPAARIDWSPLSLLSRHIDIDELAVPTATLARLPRLRPSDDPDAPLLPDIDLDIDALMIGELVLEEGITGARHIVSGGGEIHLASGRAQVDVDLSAIEADGVAGGDRLALALDAVPEDDRLDINATLAAPSDGLLAALTGLSQLVTLELAGDGTWNEWSGTLGLDAGGTATELAVSAQDGTIRAVGDAALGPFLPNSITQRLAGERTAIDVAAALGERRADLEVSLASDALTAEGGGGLNFAEGRFDDFRLALNLRRPEALNDNVRGEAVRADVGLSGRLSRPEIAFDARAARFGLATVALAGVRAEGTVLFDEGAAAIPLTLSASTATGLTDFLTPLSRNLEAEGTFRVTSTRAAVPAIAVRSANAAGRLALSVDLRDGNFDGNFDGRAPRFAWDVFGVFDARANIDFGSAPDGGFAMSGPIRARSLQINNAILDRLAGGPADITGRLSAPGNGVYALEDMRVVGPQIEAGGYARYLPSGDLDVRLSGESAAYGPFEATVSGTADAIAIDIDAESPTLGLSFRDVSAQIRGTADGYRISAIGQTDFGEGTVEALYTDDGRIIVESASLAGVTVEGTLEQTVGGFYFGTLNASGNGLDGTVRLDERQGGQFAAIDIIGRDLRFTGVGDAADLAARRFAADLTIQLPGPEGGVPIIRGEANLEDLVYGSTLVERARADFDFEDGRGAVRLVAEGRAGLPFAVAVNGRFTGNAFVAALTGELSGERFRTEEPIRLLVEDGAYRLLPSRIVTRSGEIVMSGRYGEGLLARLRTDDFDLAIINAFFPSGGFGGRLSASLDWSQPTLASFPDAELRLSLADFQRSGTIAVSQPIDATFRGNLDADGGRLTGELRERGREVGQFRAALAPLPPEEGPWRERLLAAPLDGGIRYNGPASALFSFAGLAGQSLKGQMALAADFSGEVAMPELRGRLTAEDLLYENETYGTRIADMSVEGRFSATDFVLERLEGVAGEGTVSATGTVSLSAADEYPIDATLTFDEAQLAEADNIAARVSGDLRFLNQPGSPPRIEGALTIPQARYRLVRGGEAEIATLEGVRRRSDSALLAEPGPAIAAPVDPGLWQLDITVSADNRIFVSGMGLESEWGGQFEIGGTASAYRVGGEVVLERGTFGFAGQRFDLTQGMIRFVEGDEINPLIDLRAESDIDEITAIIDITGRAYNPQIRFSSTPARPEEEVLALILFGGPPSELGAIEAVQLAASLNSLRGSGGGLNPLGELRRATGFDRLRILGADQATGRGTALAVGSYIGDDVYLEVITDTEGFTATQIEIALTRAFSLLSTISTNQGQSAGVRYSQDY